MGVSNAVVKQVYIGDGNTVTFAIPFAFESGTADLVTVVYQWNLITGIKTKMVAGGASDYTLQPPTSIGTDPSNVQFNLAPATGNLILVRREIPYTQGVSMVNSGNMLLTNIQEAIDILCLQIQQIQESDARALKLFDMESTSNFDPHLPYPDSGINLESLAIGTNPTGNGLAFGPTFGEIANAQTYAQEAQAAAVSAGNSQTSATAAAAAAAASATSVSASVAAAAASATAAAASATAAASTAATTGFGLTRFAITDGEGQTALSGETFDGTLFTSSFYFFEVIRGTTVFANGEFSMQYKNGTWQIVLGEAWGDEAGLTWSATQVGTVGQLNIATNSGAGSGTIKLKKIVNAV